MSVDVSAERFEEMFAEAIEAIPASVRKNLENVAFLVSDEPDYDQREHLELGDDDLLGLFEGYTRGQEHNAGSYLPPTITLFRLPILACCDTEEEVMQEIKDTLWHEVAHYLGLDEDDVRHEERKSDSASAAPSR